VLDYQQRRDSLQGGGEGTRGLWCQESNLLLNINKPKEKIVDFRKQQREHPPIHMEGTAVGKVESFFKFLGVHITDN
jgi:hypothetical protein